MDSIYDKVRKEFKERGCYFLNDEEIEKVRKTIIIDGSLNAKIVGQTALYNSKISKCWSSRKYKNFNRRSWKCR